MRPVGLHTIPPECALISRPRLALLFIAIMLISLFLTFHILYDSAVYSIQTNAILPDHQQQLEMNDIDQQQYYQQLAAHSPLKSHPASTTGTAAGEAAVNSQLFDQQLVQLSESAASKATRHPLINPYRFPKTCRRLPQALIVGVRKAGTRALLEMLYLHPRVQKAAGEVHFFDRDENYNLGLEWYRKKMPFSFRGQITIEKSPSYFVMPEVPERVRAMNATIKILIIVRDPVTRAISDYTQLRSHAATAAMPLPSATAAKSFEELVMLPNGTVNEAYRPLVVSLYHLHIQRWLEVFPREQILIVNGDRLIEDPVSQLQQIETFLGLEHRIGRNNFYFNETKGFYCLRTDTADKCLRETKGRKHPHVDPVVMLRLRRYFSEHNQRFYEMIGEDLGWPEV